MSIRILSPEGRVGGPARALARSPEVLAGCRLVVLDNGKPGAELLLRRAAEGLARRTGASFAGVRRKRTAATPCEEEILGELAQAADLVLTGTAD
jgi:hypothetical protein